jgi:hypothetical protein
LKVKRKIRKGTEGRNILEQEVSHLSIQLILKVNIFVFSFASQRKVGMRIKQGNKAGSKGYWCGMGSGHDGPWSS